MAAFAVLSGPLPKLGVIAVALLAAAAMLAREDTARAWAMLGALVLSPVLLLADIWHSPQLHVLHRHPLDAAAAAVVAFVVLGAAATAIARRPGLLAPLAVIALPFRVPISAGDSTSNLLVPLYLVVAAGALAWLVPALYSARSRGGRAMAPPGSGQAPGWLERLLAAAVVLYAIQAAYSSDFVQALQNTVFFYVPFALLFSLLRRLSWDRALLTRCLVAIAGLAVLFAGVGYVEYATKTLLLNPKVIAANDVHAYFTVNSVFLDPDIFGRFLALVMILLVAALIHDRRPRRQLACTVVLAILWGGLVLSLSRSSMAALLVGMATLAALRWKLRPVLVVGAAVVVAGAAAVAISPKTFGLNQGLNGASSGRASLVSGGLRLFGDRPAFGFGSGSFVTEYRAHSRGLATTLAASHTIPITVAAEQGVVGELGYVPLVVVALLTLLRGDVRRDAARTAIGAAFLALVLHTMLYADFLEDPETWTLLAIGAALAAARRQELATEAREARRRRRQAAPAPV